MKIRIRNIQTHKTEEYTIADTGLVDETTILFKVFTKGDEK